MTGRCTSLPRGSLLAVALLCALPLFPQSRPADLRSLVEAEKSFAALSAREGVKEAFLKYLADDAIVFRPHPVNGREVWVSRPSPTFLLSWYPSHAEVSADGSLGFTTGPSVFTDTTHGSRLDQHGHFVTVWKRGADSVWKVALDAGIGHAEILPPPPVFNPEEVMTESSAAGPLPGTWSDTVLALERSCGEIAAKHGLSAVYARYARSDIRIYRDGRAPSVGVPPVDSISDKLGGRL